jgi:eukaryotic-like serine/threonine-protein kinase
MAIDIQELDPSIRIRAPLRCDGVGRLDCAEDTESGMRMAVRWLPVDANGEAAARAVEGMPMHPVLPRIRRTGRVGSAAYVAMDFPEGRLLTTVIDTPLPSDALARIGADMADALSALHEEGVIHGELSSDSVLMLPDGRAILWDVPLVLANRLTDRRGEERVLAHLIRVAPFLSPERARGLPVSMAADVYALGSLLCFAAGGVLPTGGTTLGVVHQIAAGQWKPEVPRRLPLAVADVLGRMIDANPLARPNARTAARALSLAAGRTPTFREMPAVIILPPVQPQAATAPSAVATPPMRPALQTPQLMARAVAPSVAVHERNVILEPSLALAALALQRATWLRAGLMATAAVLGLGLIGAIALSGKQPSAAAEEVPQVAPEAHAAPEPNVSDLLAPLVLEPEVSAPAPRPPAAPRRQSPRPAAARASPAPIPAVQSPAPATNTFDFLPQNVPAPTQKLGRPSH